jgi:hypothetical protein
MNVIITAQVTYEIFGAEDIEEAVKVFQSSVKGKVSWDDGGEYIGTKEMFITEMTDEGTFMESPQMWEIEEVE